MTKRKRKKKKTPHQVNLNNLKDQWLFKKRFTLTSNQENAKKESAIKTVTKYHLLPLNWQKNEKVTRISLKKEYQELLYVADRRVNYVK